MTDTAIQASSPWYRHGWVWAVISIPFSAVAFGIVMVVSANYQPDDLVVDDYYKAGKSINRQIAFDREATTLGMRASLQSITSEGLLFQIDGADDSMAASLALSLFHVTNDEEDLTAELIEQGGGLYSVHSPVLVERLSRPGVWYLEIRDQENGWRLRSRIVAPADDLSLAPAAGNS